MAGVPFRGWRVGQRLYSVWMVRGIIEWEVVAVSAKQARLREVSEDGDRSIRTTALVRSEDGGDYFGSVVEALGERVRRAEQNLASAKQRVVEDQRMLDEATALYRQEVLRCSEEGL